MRTFKLNDDVMKSSDIMFAAKLAFSGGIFEEMPIDVDDAIDAFESQNIIIEEIK